MTDTHCHIYCDDFDDDRDAVVTRALEAGVGTMLLPNINRDSIAAMLALSAAYPSHCFPLMGLHPEDVGDDYRQALDYMHSLLTEEGSPYVGVGEVGLDFYWDDSHRCEQIDAFAVQVGWARELGLPLSIHCRKAHREMVDVLRGCGGGECRGVFHCFGGTLEEARELLAFEGFALGIGGVLTYKKSALPAVVRELPISRLTLETDAPYLAPVPCRGKRNEPAFLPHTLRRLAEETGQTAERVEEVTDNVALTIFPRLAGVPRAK